MTSMIGSPYYVAPEVLAGKYDHQCDMWSIGVIAYILLCGYPPFNGSNEGRIFRRIMACDYDFREDDWDLVRDEAKDFIKKLLVKDPQKRMTATQALNHIWL